MVFDAEIFEKELSLLIGKEVNKAYSLLLANEEKTIQSRGIEFQKQILEVLHSISEQITIQISQALITKGKTKDKKIPFYDLKKSKKGFSF